MEQESHSYISDETVLRRYQYTENIVLPLTIARWVHYVATSVFCLGLFWGLYARSFSAATCVFGVLSTISSFVSCIMAIVMTVQMAQRSHELSQILNLDTRGRDKTESLTWLYVSRRTSSHNFTHLLVGSNSKKVCGPMWDVDPHVQSLKYGWKVVSSLLEAPDARGGVLAFVIFTWFLFYGVIGFYVDIMRWAVSVGRRVNKDELYSADGSYDTVVVPTVSVRD